MLLLDDCERALLEDLLAYLLDRGDAPPQAMFRVQHEAERDLIDHLVADGYIVPTMAGGYQPSLKGLALCTSERAREQQARCNDLIPILRTAYRQAPGKSWQIEELAALGHWRNDHMAVSISLLAQLGWSSGGTGTPGGLYASISLTEAVLDLEPIDWAALRGDTEAPATTPLRLQRLEVDGYRALDRFTAELGALTVIIGANAAGKSSLFDLLQLLAFAANAPLPPEIDPASSGRRLFFAGGPERLAVTLELERAPQPLRYHVEIHGPVGQPLVAAEKLESVSREAEGGPRGFTYLSFRGGKGSVREKLPQPLAFPWTLPPQELALRRALDPNVRTASQLQGYLSAWRFYPGFDVTAGAALRRPVPLEPQPILAPDGANLSSVLFWLRTEHPDGWEELETHLGSAVPDFASLGVKAYGGRGLVMGTWREHGLKDELLLSDLSDGTLRLLCLAALCLHPMPPPLVCIDEPEIGLHPRVLPLVAALLESAATRSQLLVATHSPYLLSQFPLEVVAVMRKEDGRAVFRRPGDRESLRREVDEIGGEALARMHLSDELEARA